MKIGAHTSSAGGAEKAIERVHKIGGNCLQVFSGSPRTWKLPSVNKEDVEKFNKKKEELGVDPVYFHASYLINLGDDGRIGTLSKKALIAEFKVAEQLGVLGSVIHVGSFKDRSEDPAHENDKYPILIDNIKDILKNTPDSVHFIVENMGMKKIGKRIDEIAHIIKDVGSERMKVCLDTCHLHAAGIDISTKKKLDKFLDDFDKNIGLDRLELWHLNDSRDKQGSFRDRHENIGEGFIEKDTFSFLVNNKRIKDMPFISEVPGFDGNGPDKKNLDILKDLVK